MSILSLSFTAPDSVDEFQISYRPKGSTQSYYVITSKSYPVDISTNIIRNVDYEGLIQGNCNGKLGKAKSFKTSKYNNAIGSVLVKLCDSSFMGSVTSLKFGRYDLLPLQSGIILSEGSQADFISNVQGVQDLIITHSFARIHIKITDSKGVVQEQSNISDSKVTFNNITIDSTSTFLIEINCDPLPF